MQVVLYNGNKMIVVVIVILFITLKMSRG